MKLPSMQFYTGDWLKDQSIRKLSPAARGLWFDMLCFMWDSPRRGYLDGFPPYRSKNALALVNNRKEKGSDLDQIWTRFGSDLDQICHEKGADRELCKPKKWTKFAFRKVLGKLCGIETKFVTKLLDELDDAEIFSVTEDGVIYNRRMVKDEAKRILCTELGRKGGNPNLVNRQPGQTVNPTLNRHEPERLTQPLTGLEDATVKGVDNGLRARASSSSSPSKIKGSLSHSCDLEIPKTGDQAQTAPAQPAKPEVEPWALQLAERLKSLILANDQNAKVPKDLSEWGHECELMQRIDNRNETEILGVMKWSQADPFWRSNILSMKKLREKFTQLKLRMVEAKNQNATKRVAGDAAPVAGKYTHLS